MQGPVENTYFDPAFADIAYRTDMQFWGRRAGGAYMIDEQEERDRQRVLRNWKEECDSAALYEALAAIEENPQLRRVFGKLAASEHEHAAYWEGRLRSQGRPIPRFRPSLRTRIMAELARRLGVAFVIPSITVRELADQKRYSKQADALEAGLG